MGRMLETLRQGTKPLADQGVVDWTLPEPDDIPFIEVGNGKKMEGSSQVMAIKHPPQPAVQPPHPPTEKNLANTQKAVTLTQAKAMSIVFEPWPAAHAPSRGIATEVITYYQPSHAISRQYADLLGKILEGQNALPTMTIMLSGSKPSVGTTTALLNLAVLAAVQDKRRLVLVDTHLLRPTLAQRLGMSAAAGLQEVLAGNAALEGSVLKTSIGGMCLVAARAEDNNATGSLNPQALAWVLCWLKERFDLVLIDGPSMEEEAETATLAPLCDGMYIVVPQGEKIPVQRTKGRIKGIIHTNFEM